MAGPAVQQKERKKATVGPLGLQGWPQIEGLVPAMNSKVGLEAPGTISGRSYWSQQSFSKEHVGRRMGTKCGKMLITGESGEDIGCSLHDL